MTLLAAFGFGLFVGVACETWNHRYCCEVCSDILRRLRLGRKA